MNMDKKIYIKRHLKSTQTTKIRKAKNLLHKNFNQPRKIERQPDRQPVTVRLNLIHRPAFVERKLLLQLLLYSFFFCICNKRNNNFLISTIYHKTFSSYFSCWHLISILLQIHNTN